MENQRNLEFHRFYWVIEEKKEKHVPVNDGCMNHGAVERV